MNIIDTKRLAKDRAYWDKVAPEGATHYDPEDMGAPWMRELESNWMFYWESKRGWVRYLQKAILARIVARLVIRPDAQEEWTGTGLPPVGEVCKYDWTESGFFSTAIVRYRGDKLIIVSCEGSERVVYVEDAAEQLRPIRTHAQNEREELEDLLKGAIALDFSVQTMVSCIIARGYRLER